MKTILNKLRISTGFATLSADECALLRALVKAANAYYEAYGMNADYDLRRAIIALRDKKAA